MYLKNLSVVNFKNYAQAELHFSSRINCFVGNNGVGKTNLLDAIHYLALCKSYFNPVDSQNIMHDQEFSVIQGDFERKEKTESIYCGIQRNKRKQFRRNKKDYPRLSDHIGLIPLVMISPSDSSLILDGGEERRKFMNGVISQYDKAYLEDVMNYNRILTQRNKHLKTLDGRASDDSDMLEVYNEQLAGYGQSVFTKRNDFVTELVPVFSNFYTYISGGVEKTGLTYESQLLKSNMQGLLKEALRKDLILQYTTVGVHRDDLEMLLDGFPLRKVGSQGQQKTYQVALKLGKFEFIRQVSGITPILLLDDIFDKFDAGRVEQIIRLVSENNFGQIFITDTAEQRMKNILERINIEHKMYRIRDNQEIEEMV